MRILQGYHAVISARVFDHRVLQRMAAVADVPIVNLLSDRSHPLQAFADALTMEEELGSLNGRRIAWVGDYNNVARSLAEICVMLGATASFGCPPGFAPDDAELERLAILGLGSVELHHRAVDAVAAADVVHADTWVSMGQDDEKEQRVRAFEAFTVDEALMDAAAPQRRVHALPAGVSGPRSHRRRDRRAAQSGDPPGTQSPARSPRRLGLSRRSASVSVKQRRQQAIARLIGQHPVGNQPRLLELLAHEGVRTTQATVSRDLDELGVIKVRAAGGQTVYALPALEADRIAPSEQLRRVLGEWVADVAVSGNIVVVRTPPGCAHVVASALDRSAISGLLGTVAGDDTLMCVAAAGTDGARLAADLRELAGFESSRAAP